MLRSERTDGDGGMGSVELWLTESGPEKDDSTEVITESIVGSNERLVSQL